jgi:integrase
MGVKIRERKPGQWWLFVNYKKHRMAKLAGDYETAVEAKAFIEKQIAFGQYRPPPVELKRPAVTTEAYWKKFQQGYLAASCRGSTQQRYRQCFDGHILPIFKAVALKDITREKVKDFIPVLVAKGLARHSIRNITSTFCTVLSHAVEDGLIPTNPALRLPRYFRQAPLRHPEIEPLTFEEVPVFLETARAIDGKRRKDNPEIFPLLLTAVHTGMRAGELAGLEWADIDWRGRFVMVKRSIGRDGRIYPPKNGKVRRIDLSDEAAAELLAYRRRRVEELFAKGITELPRYVFASRKGTARDLHNIERRGLEACLKAAKLHQRRFHDLRHTFASLLIRQNVSLAYIKEQMGHSSIKVTVDIYGHLQPGAGREAMNLLPGLRGKCNPGATSQEARL